MGDSSAGKKLSSAREARGLSLDAAAHATKMRPDKILALESDDYSRFGSTAYAKGFLVIYSRYLQVDVADTLKEMEMTDHRVNVQEYQYLNNAPEPAPVERTPIYGRNAKPPSLAPLFGFVGVCLLIWAFISARDYWSYYQRLGLDAASRPKAEEVAPQAAMASQSSPSTTIETSSQTSADVAPPAPAPSSPAPEVEPVPMTAALPAAVAVAEPPAAPPAPTPAVEENVLSVEPLKKTYVRIRKTQNSPVIYEDFLYPNGKLLKVKGTTFFIEVKDETAVQIRKNGQPIAYQAPGMSVE